MDKLRGLMGRGKSAAAGHDEQVDAGIDKAADTADAKSGHEHSDAIDSAAEKAKDADDKLTT
jgi:hypothetical protein